jgi:hypothetical protein
VLSSTDRQRDDANSEIGGTIKGLLHKPFDPTRMQQEFETILGIESLKLPSTTDSDQLSTELQRIAMMEPDRHRPPIRRKRPTQDAADEGWSNWL